MGAGITDKIITGISFWKWNVQTKPNKVLSKIVTYAPICIFIDFRARKKGGKRRHFVGPPPPVILMKSPPPSLLFLPRLTLSLSDCCRGGGRRRRGRGGGRENDAARPEIAKAVIFAGKHFRRFWFYTAPRQGEGGRKLRKRKRVEGDKFRAWAMARNGGVWEN